jgi:hypothetical protein
MQNSPTLNNSSNHLDQSVQEKGKHSVSTAEGRSTGPNFEQTFEELALFVAQAWKDDHPDADSTEANFENCVAHVTHEMDVAAIAVGGITGLEILTGGGSEAACTVCKQILSL